MPFTRHFFKPTETRADEDQERKALWPSTAKPRTEKGTSRARGGGGMMEKEKKKRWYDFNSEDARIAEAWYHANKDHL